MTPIQTRLSEGADRRRRALLGRLALVPGRVAGAARATLPLDAASQPVAGTPAADLPRDGEWSAEEIVLHLIAVEEQVWQVRLRQMAAEDNPRWVWAEPDLDRTTAATLNELLGAFSARRGTTLRELDRLDDAGWTRVGTHAVFGVLDVEGLLRVALDHDDEHVADLERRAAKVALV